MYILIMIFLNSGSVTFNEWNRTILTIAMVLSMLVAIKLLWLGLFLGRKTYGEYRYVYWFQCSVAAVVLQTHFFQHQKSLY